MKQEDKDLLIKDLCARLPYGVFVEIDNVVDELCKMSASGYCQLFFSDRWYDIEKIKLYLFPMSSMTAEQRSDKIKQGFTTMLGIENNPEKYIDWLNEHHFDYRGLIDKGLAIDATNLNIY